MPRVGRRGVVGGEARRRCESRRHAGDRPGGRERLARAAGRAGGAGAVPALLRALQEIVGDQYTLTDRESLAVYGYDSTPELESRPGAVLLPGSTGEVVRIMRLCHGAGVSVTPRGSGTNLSGGSLSVDAGVVIQTSRMNRIIEVDEENLTATVEPGVVTSALHREVESRGLFYPPDPGSMNISTMGGTWPKIRAACAV